MDWASHLVDDDSLREQYIDRDLSRRATRPRSNTAMNLVTVGALCGIVALVLVLVIVL